MKHDSLENLGNHYLFAWGFHQGAGRPARLLPAKLQWMRENGIYSWPEFWPDE